MTTVEEEVGASLSTMVASTPPTTHDVADPHQAPEMDTAEILVTAMFSNRAAAVPVEATTALVVVVARQVDSGIILGHGLDITTGITIRTEGTAARCRERRKTQLSVTLKIVPYLAMIL